MTLCEARWRRDTDEGGCICELLEVGRGATDIAREDEEVGAAEWGGAPDEEYPRDETAFGVPDGIWRPPLV